MNIINKDFQEEMKQFNLKYNFGLTDYECDCYSNMFDVLNNVTGKQFTFEKLFDTYDFFTDVLDGARPDIDMFSTKDAFKGFYRLSKRYSTTKNLTEEQRLHLCFVIYWAKCVMTMDEETNEPVWNMACFEEGTEAILNEYRYQLKQFPDKFTIKIYSDPNKADYGYTIENPIEVTSVSIQYQYLSAIETEDGKKITFERIGSFAGKDNIFVDGYDIYVKGILKNKKIATLYITGAGALNSTETPKGFRFIEE